MNSSVSTDAILARAAVVLLLGNVLSRILGLVREQIVAYLFGASAATDSFVAASQVPTMVYDLLLGGAVTAVLVPVFADYAKNNRELSALFGAMLALAGIVLGISVVVLVLLAEPLVRILVPGFSPESLEQTVSLTRLASPAVAFLGLSGVVNAALYAGHRPYYPAFCAAVYNLGIILMALLFVSRFGVVSLVIGVLVGSAGQLVLQAPGLWRMGIRPRAVLSHPGVRQILRLYAPVFAGLIITQLAILLDRNLASRTGEGSIAAMNYATRLVQLPIGLVGSAIALAVLPLLAAEGRNLDTANFRRILNQGVRLIVLLILPVFALMLIWHRPIVELVYQRGAFDAADASATGLALFLYSLQLPLTGLDQLFIFAFYARQNTRTPVLVGLLGIGFYLAVALPLLQPLGMPGLVLANTVQNSGHALVMLWLLSRMLGGVGGEGISRFIATIGATTLLIALVAGGMLYVQRVLTEGGGTVGLLALVVGGGGVLLLAYLGVLRLLKLPELALLAEMVPAPLRAAVRR
ncbi:MAG: murein biosynthesis integral membrane protein MurJ [Chloroflexi bacterium]|nr:murein biosynthesis integral membrane protein MurJ [Chloroflexota bacterium]